MDMNNEQQAREAIERIQNTMCCTYSNGESSMQGRITENDLHLIIKALVSAPEAGKCVDTEEVIEKLGYAVRVLSEGVTVANCTERMIAAVNMASRALEDYNKYKGLPSLPTPPREGE